MSDSRRQILAFVALSVVAAGLTAILSRSHGALFEPYFGGANPFVVVVLVIVAGAVSLSLLQARAGLRVLAGAATLRGVGAAAGLATLFGLLVVAADLFIRFSPDMNVPPPEALLFYPAIGFVVEIVFHTLPLSVLLVILTRALRELKTSRVLSVCMLLVALLEPAFQLWFMKTPLSWPGAFVWLHLLAFNLVELHLFRRHDFVSMFAFRLVYYLYWHILWGVLRLQVLF